MKRLERLKLSLRMKSNQLGRLKVMDKGEERLKVEQILYKE